MKLISQHSKRIMEECKSRARDVGLRFDDDTLEYIVSNRDLLELSARQMIPTLYDYWIHDVNTMHEKGRYELYPHNPYETVINSRPAISFYNDNNPDWLNVMIFYHVLAHIDFFQNNLFFKHTWNDDFVGKALADKRLVARLRAEHGRWVDYVIEFGRGIDNIVGYYHALRREHGSASVNSPRLDYYFDVFLQQEKKTTTTAFQAEIERYNQVIASGGDYGESIFFAEIKSRHPEFEALYRRYAARMKCSPVDVLQYIMENSPFLHRDQNKWMLELLHVVRSTSLYFQPQMRTKIFNEGWASYWHELLFRRDSRIAGNEVNFSRIHARVTGLPRVGLNPYAIGLRLIEEIEQRAHRGALSYQYRCLVDREQRRGFALANQDSREVLFRLRENECDFSLINQFLDQDFVDRYNLFVSERVLDSERQVWQYIVKSRNAEQYKTMLLDSLYHPPNIVVDSKRSSDHELVLVHHWEDKPLVEQYLPNTMLGIEYLWGGAVRLETFDPGERQQRPVNYVMHERKLQKQVG